MFSEPTKFQVKTFFIVFAICLALEWVIIQYFLSPAEDFSSEEETVLCPIKTDKVVIGVVSCQKKNDSTPDKFFKKVGINEEALVMMRSVLISARLYGVSQVEFHLFVEKEDDPMWFHKQMARNNWVEDAGVEVSMYFHSAMKVVPDKHKKHMVYHLQYRCAFVKMFFSSALPDVDSIIYLDTDFIVTGNIAKLWRKLGKMKGGQVIGVARNNEPENHYMDHLGGFGDILPLHESAPKGLNSGLLVMNLTKMRQHRWEERFVRTYEEFSKMYPNMDDQRTLNLMMYFDPGQLHLVPCNFHIMFTNCDHGWVCQPALRDPMGIQAVHGAGGHFDMNGRFRNLFKAYRNFAWFSGGSNIDDDNKGHNINDTTRISLSQQIFMERIVKPVRKSYQFHYNKLERSKSIKLESKCYGTLNRLLFKNFEKFL